MAEIDLVPEEAPVFAAAVVQDTGEDLEEAPAVVPAAPEAIDVPASPLAAVIGLSEVLEAAPVVVPVDEVVPETVAVVLETAAEQEPAAVPASVPAPEAIQECAAVVAETVVEPETVVVTAVVPAPEAVQEIAAAVRERNFRSEASSPTADTTRECDHRSRHRQRSGRRRHARAVQEFAVVAEVDRCRADTDSRTCD